MIEIVAKDYNHFYNILTSYKIPETEALFIPWTDVEVNDKVSTREKKNNVQKIIDCSDWMDYSSCV